jgi:ABC-type maltose transport system permease subunit
MQLARLLVAILGGAYAIFPALIVLSAALDTNNSLVGQGLLPRRLTLDNFERLINDPQMPVLLWLWNSVKIAGITALIVVTLTALAAYAFSRFRYRGRRASLLAILIIQVFPNILAVVALFLLLQQFGRLFPWLGLDTHAGLILIYSGGAMGVNTWLMKGYFDSIPRELDESARVDGASHLTTFALIILPLVRPILVVIGLFTFIGTYSDFLLARVMLISAENYTLALGLTLFIRGQYTTEWGVFTAAALVGTLPILTMFFILQRYLTSGLTLGATKG